MECLLLQHQMYKIHDNLQPEATLYTGTRVVYELN